MVTLLGKRGQFLELNGGKIERGSVPSPPSRFAEREAFGRRTRKHRESTVRADVLVRQVQVFYGAVVR